MLSKTLKFKIGTKEYGFKITNRTILKIDDKYGNYGTVIQGIMEGQQFYTNALKLMSCSCVDTEKVKINDEEVERIKEFTIEELADSMTAEQMQSTSTFVLDLYFDYMGIETKKNKEVKEEKN